MSAAPAARRVRDALPFLVAALLCLSYWFAAAHAKRAVSILSPDSAYYAIVARNLAEGSGFTIEVVSIHSGLQDAVERIPDWHGLLQMFTLAGVFYVAGADGGWLPVLAQMYGSAAAFATFLLGRRLFGATGGLVACILTLVSPLMRLCGDSGFDDVGFCLLFVCTLYLQTRALDEDRPLLFAAAGCCAGVALLQKLMGLFLPATFLVAFIVVRQPFRRVMVRWVLPPLIPFALCVGAYLFRNYLAFGHVGFEFASLDWIRKSSGLDEVYLLRDHTPGTWTILAELGPGGVAAIVGAQFKAWLLLFFPPGQSGGPVASQTLWSPAWIGVAGLLCLPLIGIRHRRFAWLAAASVLASAAFVCVLYHVEPRYFLFLVPLLSLGFAGAIADALRVSAALAYRRWLRVGALALVAAAMLPQLPWLRIHLSSLGRALTTPFPARSLPFSTGFGCIDWVTREVPEGDAVLSLIPWPLHWYSRRPSVVIPSGGAKAIHRVAEHYGARWILLTGHPVRSATVNDTRSLLANPEAGWRSELAYKGEVCSVFRYEPVEPAVAVPRPGP